MAEFKSIRKISLPIIEGKQTTVMFEDGQTAYLFVKSITQVYYNQGFMFISLESKDVSYSNIPVRVTASLQLNDGQVFYKGQYVRTQFNTSVQISSIPEINKDGIRIWDNNGQEYLGKVSMIA